MSGLSRLLLILFLTYQLVQATTSPDSLSQEDQPTSSGGSQVKRTMYNIVWGCVSTTFICAWTAIHPNIPPRESMLKQTLRRLELMWWAVVAPETLPCWALDQLLAARTVRDMYNKGKCYQQESIGITRDWFSLYELPRDTSRAWTLKHGHFLIMGGFHLIEPVERDSTVPEIGPGMNLKQEAPVDISNGQATSTPFIERNAVAQKVLVPSGNQAEPKQGRVTILTLEMLKELVKDPDFEIRITEDEITDRSKVNTLSKMVFMFQTTWFDIIQCVMRTAQGLPLTQLELTTLALASLNGITLTLWWHKPLGVQAPIYVNLKRKLTDAERNTTGRTESARSAFIVPIQEAIYNDIPTQIRDVSLCETKESVLSSLKSVPLLLGFIPSIFFPLITRVGMSLCYIIVELWQGSRSFSVDATHVPTYYVPAHEYSNNIHVLLLVLLGSIFGGIHCAGWNFPFPVIAAQQLWRISSLGVTIIPIGWSAILLVKPIDTISSRNPSYFGFKSIVIFFTFFLIVMYAAARLVLLEQAIVLLKTLPPGAFIAIDWTKCYPHLSSTLPEITIYN